MCLSLCLYVCVNEMFSLQQQQQRPQPPAMMAPPTGLLLSGQLPIPRPSLLQPSNHPTISSSTHPATATHRHSTATTTYHPSTSPYHHTGSASCYHTAARIVPAITTGTAAASPVTTMPQTQVSSCYVLNNHCMPSVLWARGSVAHM